MRGLDRSSSRSSLCRNSRVLGGRHDISTSDSTIGPCANHGTEINTQFLCLLLGKRGCYDATTSISIGNSLWSSSRRSSSLWRSRSSCCCRDNSTTTSSKCGSIGLKGWDITLLSCNNGHGGTDIGNLTFRSNNGRQITILEGFHVHISLIGFHDHDGLARTDRIALRLEPGYDLTLLHSTAECGHVDLTELAIRCRNTSSSSFLYSSSRSRHNCNIAGCLYGGNIRLILHNNGHKGSNIRSLTFTSHNLGNVSILKGLDVHIGFVGFDYHDGLARADLIAFRFEPGYDLTFRHGTAEGWHVHFCCGDRVSCCCSCCWFCWCTCGFLYRSTSTSIGNLGNLTLLTGNQRHNLTDVDTLTFTGNNLGQITILEGFHVHISLIGFHDHDGLTCCNLLAFRFEPADDASLLHSAAEGWHCDFDRVCCHT
mmetsp:Transcript_28452/g.41880  ORF Transcript_28452/g.41880 Transcript_28452/m.41880 type:complete len:426 (+) Transcript_28452:946-2223(+)